jgi:uncharacterized low-complexity protein
MNTSPALKRLLLLAVSGGALVVALLGAGVVVTGASTTTHSYAVCVKNDVIEGAHSDGSCGVGASKVRISVEVPAGAKGVGGAAFIGGR